MQRMIATVEGYGGVLVFARSLDQLAKRIEWVVGRPVSSIQPEKPESTEIETRARTKQAHDQREAERLEALRKVAECDLPGHDCNERREILAARLELGETAA